MNTNQDIRKVAFYDARGSLPAWFWRELSNSERTAKGNVPALVVQDGRRKLICIDAEDWNELLSNQRGGSA